MEKINYTAHTFNVYSPDGSEQIEAIEPSGMMVRILNERKSVNVDGIRFSTLTSKALVLMSREDFFKKNKDASYIPLIHPFPDPRPGIFYIVSSMVQDASVRVDLLSPDTYSPVLDADGNIIGCTGYIVKSLDDL